MDIEVSSEDKAQSIQLKDEGNELFKQKEYLKSIEKYTEALSNSSQNYHIKIQILN